MKQWTKMGNTVEVEEGYTLLSLMKYKT